MNRIIALLIAFTLGQLTPEAAADDQIKLPSHFDLKGVASGSFNEKSVKEYDFTVISFFASWCRKCSTTMHKLNDTVKTEKGVRWVAVSVDEDIEMAREYFKYLPAEHKKLKHKTYLDPNVEVAKAIKVKALPTYVIVDRKGKVIHAASGHPDAKEIQKIRKLFRTLKLKPKQ